MDKRTFYYWLYTFLLVSITIIAGVWLTTSTMYTATITNSADSVSEPVSVADAKSIATQGNGNTQNIQFNSEAADRVTVRTTPRSTPQVYAPAMNATAPCRISVSAGISSVPSQRMLIGQQPKILCYLSSQTVTPAA